MLRKCVLSLSSTRVNVLEPMASWETVRLIHDRLLQAELTDAIAGRSVILDLDSTVCSPTQVSRWGRIWTVFTPDAMLYLPVMDILASHSVSVKSVRLAGKNPWKRWTQVADGLAVLGVVMGIGTGLVLHQQKGHLSDRLDQLRQASQQRQVNLSHRRSMNERLLTRIHTEIDRVKNCEGIVVQLTATEARVETDAVMGLADLQRFRDSTTEVDSVPVGDQWVSVHAVQLE